MVVKREAALMPDGERSRSQDTEAAFDKLNLTRGIVDKIQVFSSVFLRIFIYIFLRWIPSGFCVPVVNTLYVTYLLSWLFRQSTVQSVIVDWMSDAQLSSAKHDLKKLGASVAIENQKGVITRKDAKHPIESKGEDHQSSRSIPNLSAWETIKMTVLGHSTRSSSANLTSLGLHTLLALFFWDALYSPYVFPSYLERQLQFARVGALSPKTATIHVRYPFPLGHLQEILRGEGEEGLTWNALIEEDTAGGSLGGLLRSGKDIYSNPEPIRIVYREVYGSGFISSAAASNAMTADEGSLSGSPSSIDGRPRSSPKRWERGPLLRLTDKSDWTASAKLDGLWPATEYEWRLAFVHNSTFAPMPSRARRFVTWPDPRLSAQKNTVGISPGGRASASIFAPPPPPPLEDANHFSFAFSSCAKPDFPWAPTQFWAWSWVLRLFGLGDDVGEYSTRNRIQGFDRLAEAVLKGREQPALRFFLQLGDLIYADVPRFGGPKTSAYRKLYRNLFASESFRRVYERLPIIGIYDDHEVKNNWGGTTLIGEEEEEETGDKTVFEVKELDAFAPAQQAWKEYVGNANPSSLEDGENYFTFRYGDTAFFVMDTRKHRTPHQLPDDEAKTMLGYKQRDAFLRWLGAVNTTATFKFVVSSVPFTTLWGGPLDWDGKKDSWAAYTTEREELLRVMQYVPNVIVLSGDRHEFASISLAAQGSREGYHPVTEFSTSPLNMFYLPIRTLSKDHGLGSTGQEKLLKYLPDGNIKWTELEVDTRDAYNPLVHIRVMIDGKQAWQVEYRGKPVRQTRNAIGDMAKSFLELLNWKPRRWF